MLIQIIDITYSEGNGLLCYGVETSPGIIEHRWLVIPLDELANLSGAEIEQYVIAKIKERETSKAQMVKIPATLKGKKITL